MARIYQQDSGRLAFCSRYLTPAAKLEGGDARLRKARPSRMVHDVTLLFALDAYLWHYDRGKSNTNALVWQERVVAIDHDRAFYRIEAVDESGVQPDYTEAADLDALRNHVAFPYAREYLRHHYHEPFFWNQFSERIEALDDQTLKHMASRWPDELDRNRHGQRIGYKADLVQFLTQRRGCVKSVMRQVRDVLA